MSKLIKACIALAAFVAFAVVPANAFAVNDPLLTTDATESVVASHEKPATIVGTHTSTSLLMTNSSGETLVECDTATISGDLETNTGTGSGTGKIEGTITSATFNNHEDTHCKGLGTRVLVTPNPTTNGLPWCLISGAGQSTDEFIVRGNACTEESRPIQFTLHLTGLFTCSYERASSIPGTYTTHNGSATGAVLSISKVEFKKSGGSLFCPTAGFLDLSFEIENGSGTALVVTNQ